MEEDLKQVFHNLWEMTPALTFQLLVEKSGLSMSEIDELLYNPPLIEEGEINDFQKMMRYRPVTEDLATKIGLLFGEECTKEVILLVDRSFKEILDKKGYPVEAYNDFFEYCHGWKL